MVTPQGEGDTGHHRMAEEGIGEVMDLPAEEATVRQDLMGGRQ